MKVFESDLYIKDLEFLSSLNLPWEKLKNKAIMITGASGQIGSVIIDTLMYKNKNDNLNCLVYALGRSEERMKTRFAYCWNNPYFYYLKYDSNELNFTFDIETVDFIIHLASNTHPVQYATDPIGTITTNIFGLKSLLDFGYSKNCSRIIFASSNEIYGENRGDKEKFDEDYCGYINSNTLRAGYPESKRCGEALCQAYISQKNMDIVIPRITRTYGPTLLKTDSKALSQFLHNALEGNNIVLKSEGNQYFSYLHITDTVSGLFTVLLKGKTGEAYNISDETSDIKLKDLAALIADCTGTKVVFELPDSTEQKGFSKATKALLDNHKLKELGWSAKYSINSGIKQTLDILKILE